MSWGDDTGRQDTHLYPEDEFVAVVGMAGRYPEAPNLDAFWQNLRSGRDCLRTFTDDELDGLGIPPERYNADNFVRRGTVLPDHDRFDAAFFGFTPRQAEIMDPQSRIFLETCYEALEAAGYNPFDTGHSVGVFGGSNPCDYASLIGVADPSDSLDAFDQLIGLDRDFLTTRVSHHLGLNGPSMNLQTACSTSLVAVHTAVQSLLAFECSMALAGGVTVNFRQGVGYFHQPGMILSPSGQCRAFDADASGTTLGQGCGVVVLKRLDDAQADDDHILAVIRGSAINNDAGNKMTYTAPSEDGQTAVIAAAQEVAGVNPDTIGYVETHGTGTLLGDPIEIAALTRAFRAGTDRQRFCAIGSVKTNVGHTDAAAGITGFIKAVLALHHREIPPSIHFSSPNPGIDFDRSPFYVNTTLTPWADGPSPRRAGVSAFGIGGTNAHVVLEEAPRPTGPTTDQRDQLLVVSARSEAAADQRLADLTEALGRPDSPHLSDVGFTLRQGRPHLTHRRAVVANPGEPLRPGRTDRLVAARQVLDDSPRLVWTFSGQGSQHPEMGYDLYRSEPIFQEAADATAARFQELLGIDLLAILYGGDDLAGDRLQRTAITQPALFTIQRAMSALLHSWGVAPDAVIGHSIGEYGAAVDAGIMTETGAAQLVAERGRLMQAMPPGAMLSVNLDPEAVRPYLTSTPGSVPAAREFTVGVAAHNGPGQSVVSGPSDQVAALEKRLAADDVATQVLRTSHAFHSDMMSEAAAKFETVVADADLQPPTVPLISNVTGQPITDQQATDPRFWAKQILHPVRFADCITTAIDGPTVFLELGPGQTLTTLARTNAVNRPDRTEAGPGPVAAPEVEPVAPVAPVVVPVATMRRPNRERDDRVTVLEAVGQLWTAGVDVNLARVEHPTGADRGRRVPLPTYPFERIEAWRPSVRHVLALPEFGRREQPAVTEPSREPLDDWLYVPSWQRDPMPDPGPDRPASGHANAEVSDDVSLLLVPAGPGGDALAEQLRAGGQRWLVARPHRPHARDTPTSPTSNPDDVTIDPDDDGSLTRLVDRLTADGKRVSHITHALLADPAPAAATVDPTADLDRLLAQGLHSALACARVLGSASRTGPTHLDLVTVGACSVTGEETVEPAAAALLGPTRVVPLEYGNVTTRLIDLPTGLSSPADRANIVAHTGLTEPNGVPDAVVAIRHNRRWIPTVARRPAPLVPGRTPLRTGGTYLIIGGLGGVGLSLARYLAQQYEASLILTGRHGRPQPPADGTAPDPETAGRLAVIDQVEQAAASMEIAAVDLTDQSAMTGLVNRVLETHGRIDGIIVAAGQADQQGAIHRRSRTDTVHSIAAKVHGLSVLEQALETALGDPSGPDHPLGPDFVLLSSSVASTLYHNRFAQVGYVAGNSFAEAFAHRGRQRGWPTLTVAWDDWTDIGMSVRAAQSFAQTYGSDIELVDRLHSFSPDEGVALFERALQADEPVVVVSTTDLAARIAADVDVISPFLQQATAEEDSHPPVEGRVGDGDGSPTEPGDRPRGDSLAELVLATWQSILGYPDLDLTADFFELGGDSLQAARMTDRLSRQLGVEVPVDLMFDFTQAGALVEALEPMLELRLPEAANHDLDPDPDGAATGRPERAGVTDLPVMPLGPNQRRFVDRDNPNPNHFNIVILLEPRQPVTADQLRQAIGALVARHDALRVRLIPPTRSSDPSTAQSGPWHQTVVPVDQAGDPVTVIDLSEVPQDNAGAAVTAAASEAQQTLDLVNGPLFRVVLFELPDRSQRLLVLAHHLISDRVSLLLTLDGLSDGLLAAADGRTLPAGPATSSLAWAEALRHSTETPETAAEVARWANKPWDRLQPIPKDLPSGPADNRNENVGVITVELASDGLDGAGGPDVRLDELVLACLARALGEWNGTGLAHIDVLGFGRRLPLDLDVTRSLGMFIAYSPVLLDVSDHTETDTGTDTGATTHPVTMAVTGIREDLEESWRLDPARFSGPDELRRILSALPQPEVLFNFVGKPISVEADGLLGEATEPIGPSDDRAGRRGHQIGVRVDLANDGTMTLVFVYGKTANHEASIQALADRTKQFIQAEASR